MFKIAQYLKTASPVKLLKKNITRSEVIQRENKLNSKGKHEKNPLLYTEKSVQIPNGKFVLIETPINLLNHEHDVKDPDYIEPSDKSKKLINDYSKRKTKIPPILLSSSGRHKKAFVANGNHRVVAALKRGQNKINAYMAEDQFNKWMEKLKS